ncbi:universal stress protein [Chloroflexota bacterium]
MNQIIVVPLDGSAVGEAALPFVEDLVLKMSPEVGVEVVLIQVLSMIAPGIIFGEETSQVSFTPEEMRQQTGRAMSYLDKTADVLRGKGITVTVHVAIGDSSEEIVKYAEEINAYLIAMSTHGRSGLSRWAFGSITHKVLRQKGSVPIVMIKAPKKTDTA